MNVLLCNVGYLLGRRSFLGGYLPSPRGALLGDLDAEREALQHVSELIAQANPDVVCLIEVDQGSFRTRTVNQVEALKSKLGDLGISYTAYAFNKYGPHRLIGNLPFFRRLGNAVLCTGEWPTIPRYLTTGMKRLLIETRLPNDITLLTAHLSVRTVSRQRQLEELATLIKDRFANRDLILAGDFNTYDGLDALAAFQERTGLQRLPTGPTVPERPLDGMLVESRTLDLVFTSPGIEVTHVEVLGQPVSDHRPIAMSI